MSLRGAKKGKEGYGGEVENTGMLKPHSLARARAAVYRLKRPASCTVPWKHRRRVE